MIQTLGRTEFPLPIRPLPIHIGAAPSVSAGDLLELSYLYGRCEYEPEALVGNHVPACSGVFDDPLVCIDHQIDKVLKRVNITPLGFIGRIWKPGGRGPFIVLVPVAEELKYVSHLQWEGVRRGPRGVIRGRSQAVLEENNSLADLKADEDYRRLKERLATLQAEANELAVGTEDEFIAGLLDNTNDERSPHHPSPSGPSRRRS